LALYYISNNIFQELYLTHIKLKRY